MVLVLLLEATVLVALSLGTGRWPEAAAVVALVSGVAAARIMQTELVQSRRDAARDRARQAVDYQQLSARAAAEHASFATTMTTRLADREQVIVRLRRALRVALRRADEADEQVRTESRRAGELQAKVEQLELALTAPVAVDDSDEVAVWDASQAPTVIDLVGWDQRAAEAAAESAEDWRRHA